MPRKKRLCAHCKKNETGGYHCRDCAKVYNAKARILRRERKAAGTLPVVFTVRVDPQDAEAIRRNAKERGQSVNRYLVEIGRAGEV